MNTDQFEEKYRTLDAAGGIMDTSTTWDSPPTWPPASPGVVPYPTPATTAPYEIPKLPVSETEESFDLIETGTTDPNERIEYIAMRLGLLQAKASKTLLLTHGLTGATNFDFKTNYDLEGDTVHIKVEVYYNIGDTAVTHTFNPHPFNSGSVSITAPTIFAEEIQKFSREEIQKLTSADIVPNIDDDF